MNRRIRCLFVWLALLVLTAELAAQDKLKETPFYPLQVGTTWHYRAGEGKFTTRVVKHEKVGDTLCALLETKRDGKVVGSEHLAVADDGVYRHDLTAILPPPPGSKDKTKTEVPITQSMKPPMLVLKLPPKKDSTWKVESKSEGQTFRGEFRMDLARPQSGSRSHRPQTDHYDALRRGSRLGQASDRGWRRQGRHRVGEIRGRRQVRTINHG
jgi:hypothetical protein